VTQNKPTLGQAIDQVVAALDPLEPGARKTALAAVCAHLGIDLETSAPPASGESAAPDDSSTAEKPANTGTHHKIRKDIRSLKDEKKPTTAKEMACLVAFHLQEHAADDEKKGAITTADLEKYFKQAGFKLPQRMQQVLPDAKGSGYFDSVGRGEYKLNAVGYNLVAHNLPKKSGES